MISTLDVVNLDTEVLTRTDSVSIPGSTIIGKIAGGLTPASNRIEDPVWKIFLVQDTGEMLKPVDPATGLYYDTEFLVRDDRAGYTYA